MLAGADASNAGIPWGQAPDTGALRKKVVRLRLDTSTDCQRALARLIRSTMAGSIATADLSRYANALMVLARLIEGGDLEKRLIALEAQAQ
jgi:hypothetical protein